MDAIDIIAKRFPSLKEGGSIGGVHDELSLEDRIAVPDILLYAYKSVLGFKCIIRPMEKIAWFVSATLNNVSFFVIYEKFGLYIYIDGNNQNSDTIKEIIKLQSVLYNLAKKQLQKKQELLYEEGSFTVGNRYRLLSMEYEFFRDRAFQAYNEEKFDLPLNPETSFYSKASIFSFFCLIEHTLILLFPFLSSGVSIQKFMKARWSEKWRDIFIDSDIYARKAFNSIKKVSDAFRNPMAHGEVNRDGADFFYHIDGFGAMPFCDSYDDVLRISGFTSMTKNQFVNVCNELDNAETNLKESSAKVAFRFLDSGLPIAFDTASRDRYLIAMQSDENMDIFIKNEVHLQDLYSNMDW